MMQSSSHEEIPDLAVTGLVTDILSCIFMSYELQKAQVLLHEICQYQVYPKSISLTLSILMLNTPSFS
jgi:hypothetical protein